VASDAYFHDDGPPAGCTALDGVAWCIEHGGLMDELSDRLDSEGEPCCDQHDEHSTTCRMVGLFIRVEDDEVLSLAEADALAARIRLREPAHIAAESHTRRSHARREAELGHPITGALPDGSKNGPS
jgi:hypothetical protein